MGFDGHLNSLVDKPLDVAPFRKLFNEIIDDILAEICLTVHKAVMLDYFLYDEFIIKDGQFVLPSCDADGRWIEESPSSPIHKVQCPSCGIWRGTKRFAEHLGEHFGTRSRRKAATSDNSKTAVKASFVPFENLTIDEKRKLLKERCCVKSQITGRLCRNTMKCPKHTAEERNAVERNL